VQYGLHCLRDFVTKTCHFIEYKPPLSELFPDAQQTSVTHIQADPEWPARYCWLIDEFWAEVEQWRKDGIVPDHYVSDARYGVRIRSFACRYSVTNTTPRRSGWTTAAGSTH